MDSQSNPSKEAQGLTHYELALVNTDTNETVYFTEIQRPELEEPEEVIEVLYNSACQVAQVLQVWPTESQHSAN